ncbi:MAG: glycerol-3-phosphate acyltransferase [marine bacterium B5-7]|nr:MAG: glycerol-3-phosphate acyltransferase [marine bacterium B5-7]
MINILLPVIAYLFGSISSAVIVSRLMRLPDPRTSGSNNPGATNVLRLGSKTGAALTLVGDVAKGIVPVLIARYLAVGDWTLAATGLAAFLGHLYPVFFGFKGGKGVATALGVLLAISPLVTAGLVLIWLAVAAIFHYSSLAALSAAAGAPLMIAWLDGRMSLVVMAIVIAVLLFWRHRSNIARLINAEESRIGSKSK